MKLKKCSVLISDIYGLSHETTHNQSPKAEEQSFGVIPRKVILSYSVFLNNTIQYKSIKTDNRVCAERLWKHC